MRKQYLRILIVLIGVTGLGSAAKGQALDQIVVKIPYAFVVAGKTLPAGTYKVNRVADNDPRALILSSFENRVSALIVSSEVESSRADKAEVSFEEVGGEHFLSKIETPDHLFSIPISRSEVVEAAAKSHGGASASASSDGSN